MSTYEGEIFNPDEVEIDDGFELLPNGKYLLQGSAVEIIEKDQGDKLMYKIEFEVVDGDYQGRKVFENINLRNPSEEAVRIGRSTLAKFMRAIGQGAFPLEQANDVLCWKPFLATIGVRRDKTGNYSDQNRITKWEPHNDGQQQAPAAPPPRTNPSTARSTQNGGSAPTQRQEAPSPQQRAAAGGSRPWDRNARR